MNALDAAIRGHVARGEPVEARWKTLRAHQASFSDAYRDIADLSPENYDLLLAVPYMMTR